MARLGATASKPWKSSATIKLTHCPLAINPTDAVAVGNRRSRKGVECRRHRSVGHRPASRRPARARPKVLDGEPDLQVRKICPNCAGRAAFSAIVPKAQVSEA